MMFDDVLYLNMIKEYNNLMTNLKHNNLIVKMGGVGEEGQGEGDKMKELIDKYDREIKPTLTYEKENFVTKFINKISIPSDLYTYIFPVEELTQEIDWYTFSLIILIVIFLVIFIYILIWFSMNEKVKRLDRKCQEEKINKDKCIFNKKCVMEEVALGNKLKDAIDKCL